MKFENKTFSILIIDDEYSVRLTLGELLRLEGYQVSTAVDGNDAINQLKSAIELESLPPFDLALLDLKMPGRDGLEVLHFIVRSSISIEVILLTAHGSMQSAIQALRHGAQDYLLKPVTPSKLIASVKKCLQHRAEQRNQQAILTQLETSINALRQNRSESVKTSQQPPKGHIKPDEKINIKDGVWFDPDVRELFSKNLRISLTESESKLFSLILLNPGKIYSYTALTRAIHGYEITRIEASGIIRPIISRLRKKLSAFPTGRNWIKNIRGKGYTFGD